MTSWRWRGRSKRSGLPHKHALAAVPSLLITDESEAGRCWCVTSNLRRTIKRAVLFVNGTRLLSTPCVLAASRSPDVTPCVSCCSTSFCYSALSLTEGLFDLSFKRLERVPAFAQDKQASTTAFDRFWILHGLRKLNNEFVSKLLSGAVIKKAYSSRDDLLAQQHVHFTSSQLLSMMLTNAVF